MMADRAFLERLHRKLVDGGKPLEAGWVALRLMAISPNAPAAQLEEMRLAFFCGAQHLWATINTILEPGAEPTEKDLDRCSLINDELNKFADEMRLRLDKPKGHA